MQVKTSVIYLLLILGVATVFASFEVLVVHEGFEKKSTHTQQPQVMDAIAATYHQIYPQRPMSHYVRGAIAFKQQRFGEAEKHFIEAIERQGTQENMLYDYAVNLVIQRASQEEVDQAIRAWQRNYPDSKRPVPQMGEPPPAGDSEMYLRGVDALRAQDFEAAKHCFEAEIATGTRTEQLLYNYALTLVLHKEDAKTIESAIALWREHFPNSQRQDPRIAVAQALTPSSEP
ncbi:MAG: hypothetical protein CL681_13640 [Blastopirellula sp.]|nr:hypothetical protein [Blastopirellula sp.]